MSEMIYLGFNGKYNLRLGETLRFVNKYIFAIEKTGNKVKYELLEDKLSNAYTMYKLENTTILAQIINVCSVSNCYCMGACIDEEKRKKVLDSFLDDKYTISFEMLSFLSEGLWPYIVKSYLRELKKEKGTFISRLTIPVNKVQKYANTIDKNKAIKRFCDELNKWLDFHMIGKITGIKTAKSENENLEIYLTIDC